MFKKDPLMQFAGIPVSGATIRSCFPDLASPEKKIQALEKSGELIRLKRNLFVVNQELTGKKTDARLCANHIYGPSYVSFQWALRYYSMIPEQVFLMTSATTKRTRSFETPIGNFSYVQVPASYFPIGVECREEQGVSFLIPPSAHRYACPGGNILTVVFFLHQEKFFRDRKFNGAAF